MKEQSLKEDSVVRYFRMRAKKYISYEYKNLIIVVAIIIVGLFLLKEVPEGNNLDENKEIILLVVNKSVFLVLLLFLARVFLKFQEFSTRRATLMYTIADAWSISNDKEEFYKMVEVLLSAKYESVKDLPDSKLPALIEKIIKSKGS